MSKLLVLSSLLLILISCGFIIISLIMPKVQIIPMLPIAGWYLDGSFQMLPDWITGGENLFRQFIYVPASVQLFFSVYILTGSNDSLVHKLSESIAKNKKSSGKRVLFSDLIYIGSVLLIYLSYAYLALWPVVSKYNLINTDVSLNGESYEKLLELERSAVEASRKAVNIGLLGVEAKFLKQALMAAKKKNRKKSAVLISARLLALMPFDKDLMIDMAMDLYMLDQKDTALGVFNEKRYASQELVELKASDKKQAWFLSEVMVKRNMIGEVLELLRPYAKRENLEVLRRYGDYCLYAKKFECALKTADILLDISPDDPLAANLKGEVLYDQGKYELAFPYFSRAHKAIPKNVRIALNLHNCHLLFGRKDMASELHKKVVMYFPAGAMVGDQGSALYREGEAYLQGEFSPGIWMMHLQAFGTHAKEEWPVLDLIVNGSKMNSIKVNSDLPRTHMLEFRARRGPNRIAVRFVNDYADEKEDRNIFLGGGRFAPVLDRRALK